MLTSRDKSPLAWGKIRHVQVSEQVISDQSVDVSSAGIMGHSQSSATYWSMDRRMKKSWLRRALPILALLVAIDILVNVWQSYYDFRAINALAARLLDVQSSLMAGRIADQFRDVTALTSGTERLLDTGTLTDATLVNLTEALDNPLRRALIGVFDPQGEHLLASSRPSFMNEVPPLDQILARVRANPSNAVILPVAWGERGAVVVAKGHQNRAIDLDAVVVIILTYERLVLDGVNLAPGTSVLLLDSEHRLVMRDPEHPTLAVGQVLREDRGRAGPTTATQYASSQIDGIERLVSTRSIATRLTPDHWTVAVGYSVSDFREGFWRSTYINAAGAAVMLLMLVSGILLILHERRLQDRVERFASMVSTVVKNMPTPVAVVDHDTEQILLTNEALLADFGAVAGAGQSFSRLFANAADWSQVCTTRMDEAIPMLTRDGTRYMLVHCAQLEFGGESVASKAVLVTLVDVNSQQQMLKELRTQADLDALTGLANRRYFENAAQKAVMHARKQGSALSILALDLDLFKRVNDTYGHAAGDRVLQVVARQFEGALRSTDLGARIGGEEFTAILFDTALGQAQVIAERIRAAIQNTPIILESGEAITQTVSIGIAAYREDESDLAAAQERADAALYSAKAAGRNRVHVYVPETSAPQDAG
ncbi:Putative diguanylate cyclase (GGDEF domain) [Cupriavidus metallidurans CH34]|uniref:diguanylate cyclase n=2 Tax=Cupriavidus metallidurans TaxID=119219 RepID=Q1LPE9_CUPMC|nr:Putative diguanylate cyclase (GGDEF domain) [Cupriavidus metallidurans CH34]